MHYCLQIVLRMRRRQRQHQIGRRREARLDAGLRGLVTEVHRQVRLADAARYDQYNVLMPLDEAQPGQLLDLAALDALGEVVVELVRHCCK
jgi:hypothetical protein